MKKDELKLTLIKEGDFLGTKCDFYKDENNNVYMTRKQIGEALQYKNGDTSIRNLHNRKQNKDRLNRFSTRTAVVRVEGGREVSRDTVIYTERGIYEIARISEQPVANDFYDWVYDQIELIRKTGGAVEQGREVEFVEKYFPSFNEETKLMMVKDLYKTNEEQQKKIQELQPKADDWSAFMDSKGNMTMAKVAKALDVDGIGRNNLFAILRNRDVLRDNNEPYQRFVDSKYFKVVLTNKNGFKHPQTLVTGKGMSWINKKMKEWGYV